MENDRNSDTWSASSKEVETQVAAFLQNGLVQRFEHFDQLLKSPDFDIEKQIGLIRLQVGNCRTLSDNIVNGNTNPCKNEATSATDAKKEGTLEGNAAEDDKDSEISGATTETNTAGVLSSPLAENGLGVTCRDKSASKRKLVDKPNEESVSDGDTPTTPAKKFMQEGNCTILNPAAFAFNNGPNGGTNNANPPTPVSQPNVQMHGNRITISKQAAEAVVMYNGPNGDADIVMGSAAFQPIKEIQSCSIIAKQAGVALPLIRSVLGDLNLFEKQLNLMMNGPTEMIDFMDQTYFKGRLSSALESFNETKEIVANIDVEMCNYHMKRAQLISELGRNPVATPDTLLSITYLDTYIFRRIHQILTELKNSYYLALTMDHILSVNEDKSDNKDNA